MPSLRRRVAAVDAATHAWLRAHSITALRISLGVMFLGFGALKFVPDLSPAQDLVLTTTRILTFGLVPDVVALVAVAVLECTIGVCLLRGGPLLKVAVALLAPLLIGILSPLVLLPGRMFPGPFHAPTLEAQYVLKDLVLVAAVMTLATVLRGATLQHPDEVGAADEASQEAGTDHGG